MQTHSNDYTLLKGRMENGSPFLKKNALERIAALANGFVISQGEAEELAALAQKNGSDILPTDALGRLDAVEQTTDELTLMMAQMIGGAAV